MDDLVGRRASPARRGPVVGSPTATVTIVNRTAAETLADLVSGGLELDPGELNGILREVWPQVHGPLYRHDAGTVIALFRRAG